MPEAVASVRVQVPAKVNPFLAVRGTRPDGYHEVTTVLQTVSLHDEVIVELHGTPWAVGHPAARKLMRLRFTHDADDDVVPTDQRNLVIRAACAVLNELGVEHDGRTLLGPDDALLSERAPTTTIELTKRIPVQAGMAGGSADAAATLIALDRLWAADLDDAQRREIAARIGADVPFCLQGGTALGRGSGSRVCRVLARGTFHWVACTAPGGGLSTADVYAAWDELDRPSGATDPDAVLQALATGDASALAPVVHNDLADAAVSLRPALADGLETLRAAGALAATVSGSGPTLLGLAADEHAAARIAEQVAERFDETLVVSSPAGGPRVEQRMA